MLDFEISKHTGFLDWLIICCVMINPVILISYRNIKCKVAGYAGLIINSLLIIQYYNSILIPFDVELLLVACVYNIAIPVWMARSKLSLVRAAGLILLILIAFIISIHYFDYRMRMAKYTYERAECVNKLKLLEKVSEEYKINLGVWPSSVLELESYAKDMCDKGKLDNCIVEANNFDAVGCIVKYSTKKHPFKLSATINEFDGCKTEIDTNEDPHRLTH